MPEARQPRPTALRRTTITPLMAALALTASGAAMAQANPYYIGATLGYAHDSNFQRFAKDDPRIKADSYLSTGIVAGLDQPFGRQRVYANVNARNNSFKENSDFDYVSYSLKAGLDWSTIERLSGNLGLSLNQQADTDPSLNNPNALETNVSTTRELTARVQWGLVSLLTLEGNVIHREVGYSLASATKPDFKQDAVSVGVKYRPSGALTLGSALRFTRGDYNNDATFDRQDIDFTANWLATGQSTLNARLSVTRQEYDGANDGRDFSGTTGLIGWIYRPTGKLQFATQLSRDTGVESDFDSLDNFTGDNSSSTTALVMNVSYALSAKIRMTAGGRYARHTNADAINSKDATKQLSFGVSYEPTRNWLLSCNAARNTRGTSNEAVALKLSSRYASNSYGCTAQFTIQ